jgi:hypothetical protein
MLTRTERNRLAALTREVAKLARKTWRTYEEKVRAREWAELVAKKYATV